MARTPRSAHLLWSLTSPFLLLLVLLTLPASPSPLTPDQRADLDRLVDRVMQCGKIPALGLSLVRDGQAVYEQGYGKPNPSNTRVRATKDTVFCLGASTQAFTSVLLASLLSYKENKTFDSPLHEIVGTRVPLPGRYRTEFMTLKDVLGHRTGLSNMDILVQAMGMSRYTLLPKLRFAPEVSHFRDSNVFNEVLFPLTEDAARELGGGGDTWYKLIHQYLFNQLGMDNTAFVHVDAHENSNLAKPMHYYQGKPIEVPMDVFKGQELVAASSSVCASASDMSKWIHFILNNGKDMDNKQVVAEAALKSTFQAVNARGNGGDTRTSGFTQPALQVSYTRDSNALGWIKGQYRGFSFVSQDGSLPGYESLTTILHERDVGVFTAFSGDGGPKAYAVKVLVNIYALDLLLHGTPWFDEDNVCNIMDQMVAMTKEKDPPTYVGRVSEPIRPLREYEGVYRNFGFGDVRVRRNESGSLQLQYGEMGHWELTPSQLNDTFTMNALPGPLWYTTHVDYYRSRGPYLAIFGSRYNDPARRIETVTIPHFARDMDPMFSKHPAMPRRYEDDLLAASCDDTSAATLPLAPASLLLASLLAALGASGR